eukprot:1232305-Amphidinium_carterae.1
MQPEVLTPSFLLGVQQPLKLDLRAGTAFLRGAMDQPFTTRGIAEDGSSHTITNTHVLALMVARHLASAEQRNMEDAAERLHAASTRPICGDEDTRPLLELLLRRAKRQMVTCACFHYCKRGSSSEASSGVSSAAGSVYGLEYSPSSLGTSRYAVSGYSSASTPGECIPSTPPSANTSTIVEVSLSSRDTIPEEDIAGWDRHRGIDEGPQAQTLHAWANPEAISQMEREW